MASPRSMLIARIVHAAPSCGVASEARALASAISPSEQTPLIAKIRHAAEAAGDARMLTLLSFLASVEQGESFLGQVPGELTTDVDHVRVESNDPGMSDLTAEEIEEREWFRSQPAQAEPPRRLRGAWAGYVKDLAKRGEDGKLVEIATRPEFAETATALAKKASVALETLSRVRNGHRHLSAAAREWLVSYLTGADGYEPPPLREKRPGAIPKPGAIAPQAKVSKAVAAKAAELAEQGHSMRAIFESAMREYLERHPEGYDLPVPPPRGPHVLRPRNVSAELLSVFDERVGGPLKRGEYLRAALHEMLSPVEEQKPERARRASPHGSAAASV